MFDITSNDPVIGIVFAADDGTVVFDAVGWQDSVPQYDDTYGVTPTPGTGHLVRLTIGSANTGDTVQEAWLALMFSPWGERAHIFVEDSHAAYVERLASACQEAGHPGSLVPLSALDITLYAQPASFTRAEDLDYLVLDDADDERARLSLVPVVG